jgi:hypothetical protein
MSSHNERTRTKYQQWGNAKHKQEGGEKGCELWYWEDDPEASIPGIPGSSEQSGCEGERRRRSNAQDSAKVFVIAAPAATSNADAEEPTVVAEVGDAAMAGRAVMRRPPPVVEWTHD